MKMSGRNRKGRKEEKKGEREKKEDIGKAVSSPTECKYQEIQL